VNPTDLYSTTLAVLTDVRSVMLSPEWQDAIDKQTADQRLAASRELVQVQQAILALSDAVLTEIAAEMKANEQGLTQATAALKSALEDIAKVQQVIQSVTSVLSVVAKILPLL
jgi:hypothetical protein